jgi:N-acyl-D-aspartate/D-glutamate deacylase
LGEESNRREATDAEVEDMQALLARCLSQGALGFSSSQVSTHNDGDGDPVPSRAASWGELKALASTVRDYDGTTLELIVPGCIDGLSDAEMDFMADLSLAAGRPLNWNVLAVTGLNPTAHVHQLEASTRAAARGAQVVALTLPQGFRIRLSFLSGTPLDGLPGWAPTFALPVDDRIHALSDPEVRDRLDRGAQSPEAGLIGALADWGILTFAETFSPETARYEGRTVADVARERGQDPFDAMLDVVVADRLRTGLRPPELRESDEGWAMRADVWRDPRAVIGGSDAGAHLDMMCGATYTTFLVGEAVRERGLLSLEEAVRLLSDVPARLYGLKQRGRVEVGWFADLVVFDPATVGPAREHTRSDLPGGAPRLFAEAEGIAHVVVNGVPIVDGDRFTGDTPGTVFRSGHDTETVNILGG